MNDVHICVDCVRCVLDHYWYSKLGSYSHSHSYSKRSVYIEWVSCETSRTWKWHRKCTIRRIQVEVALFTNINIVFLFFYFSLLPLIWPSYEKGKRACRSRSYLCVSLSLHSWYHSTCRHASKLITQKPKLFAKMCVTPIHLQLQLLHKTKPCRGVWRDLHVFDLPWTGGSSR